MKRAVSVVLGLTGGLLLALALVMTGTARTPHAHAVLLEAAIGGVVCGAAAIYFSWATRGHI